MMQYKLFTLEEARALMPELRTMLKSANDELTEQLQTVKLANDYYERCEKQMDQQDATADLEHLRKARTRFQNAIERLSKAQNSYLSRLNYWVDKVTSTGVILRDVRDGLLDFPCEENGFEYLLCWRMDESDIGFWHLSNDGFAGRKPLSTLNEYR